MKELLISLFFYISIYNVIGQDHWKQYNTLNTGDNGIIGGYIYCFFNDNNNTLWMGSGFGISQYNGKNWNTITSVDGLPADEVGVIVQDSSNNIWISYRSYSVGVSKYDGINFTHYREHDGLLNDKVNDIMVDNIGNVWFATGFSNIGGISKFNGNSWTNYSSEKGLPNISVSCIAQDKNGDILIGTIGAGTFLLQNDTIIPFCWEDNSKDWIKDIYVDKSGNIWVSGDKTYKYNVSWSEVNPFETGQFGSVYNINEDKRGRILFSTSCGFSIMDEDTFNYYDTEDNIPHNNVFSSFAKNDTIWIGTQDGAASFANNIWTKYTTNDNGLISNSVNSVFEDDKANLWYCTQYGISKFNGSIWQNYNFTDVGKEIEWVSCGIQSKDGNLWFGTVNGIFKYDNVSWEIFDYNVNNIFSGWVKDIIQDSDGNLWFASWNYLLKYNGTDWINYNDTAGFQSKYIDGLFEDSSGRIWIGSRAGISVFENNKFQHFFNGIDFNSTSPIYGFVEDKNGNIYAYGNNNILVFRENKWEIFKSGYWFHSGICDNENQLWFATSGGGLLKFNGVDTSIYTIEDGMSSNVVNSIYKASDGMFYACTNQGITEFAINSSTKVNDKNSGYFNPAIVYPNPSKGYLTISFKEKQKNTTIEVYNQIGQKISMKKYYDLKDIDMELRGPNGIYYLKINFLNGKFKVLKVLKE